MSGGAALSETATKEFEGVGLGDKRLDRRLSSIVERIADSPHESFPRLLRSEAELEAAYRFFNNDACTVEQILRPHKTATVGRCAREALVRIAHDTTAFSFEGDRQGLGPVAGKKRGFYAHCALAISGDESRAPLGVLGMTIFVRKDEELSKSRKIKQAASRKRRREDKECHRWPELVTRVNAEIDGRTTCIHLMDREADDYALFAELVTTGSRFVIRGRPNRRLRKGYPEHVQHELEKEPAVLVRTVPLGSRSKPNPNYKRRAERQATLHIRGASICLNKPQHAQSEHKYVELNVVQVFEPEPPRGEEPVSWTLYTTEPIGEPNEIVAVVDHYRARWRIEEYFKALKTGCSMQKRQLTTLDGLCRVLAVFIPVAWTLLLLRTLARLDAPPPAETMFNDVQLQILATVPENRKLPPKPTVEHAMLALADLGGHIRSNGAPGWIVLGRGFDELRQAERVWRAALVYAQREM